MKLDNFESFEIYDSLWRQRAAIFYSSTLYFIEATPKSNFSALTLFFVVPLCFGLVTKSVSSFYTFEILKYLD